MQHFLKIGGKRYGEVRNFKKLRKFASSNLKFRSSKFKFTEILICNPGGAGPLEGPLRREAAPPRHHNGEAGAHRAAPSGFLRGQGRGHQCPPTWTQRDGNLGRK